MPPTDAWLIFQQIMAGLDRQTAQVLTSLWDQATTPQAKYSILMDVLPGAVEELSGVGAQAAVDLYTELRTQAAVRSAYTPTPTPGVSVEQTEAMIRNATRRWLDGRDATKVLSQLSGGTRRLVRYPARDTIITNTRRDPARPRFARVASPRACPWCLMLVSRGAVYREETGRFRAHDFCRCDAIPVFNDSQIPEQSQRLAEEWDQVTAGTNGPEEAQAAWAEHVRAHSDFYGYHSPTSTSAGGGGGGNRPSKLAGTGGPDDPLHAQLDKMFAEQKQTATEAERSAVMAWQRPDDRFYQQVQAAFRTPGTAVSLEVAEVIEGLDSLLSKGSLTSEVTIWRGLRSSTNTVGVSTRDLMGLIDSTISLPGYLATSTEFSVAESVFTQPEGPGGAFMMQLIAPTGTPAIWVPPLGRAEFADQHELLFDPYRSILVVDVVRSGSVSTVIGKLI